VRLPDLEHGRLTVVAVVGADGEPAGAGVRRCGDRLVAVELDEHAALGAEQVGGREQAADVVEAVGAAEQRDVGLVVGPVGEQPAGVVGHVRGHRREHVDAAGEVVGQGGEAVAEVRTRPRVVGQVGTRVREGGGVVVAGVHLGVGAPGGHGRGDRRDPGVRLHEDGPGAPRERLERAACQEARALAGDEDARPDREPSAAELDPADDVLQRLARDPAVDEAVERWSAGAVGGLAEERGLLLGVHAPGGAQPGDERVGGHGQRRRSTRIEPSASTSSNTPLARAGR